MPRARPTKYVMDKLRTDTHDRVQLGELIAAAFDDAAQLSKDQREVSRLATELVIHMLRPAGETSDAPR